jgi:hypothetical protein
MDRDRRKRNCGGELMGGIKTFLRNWLKYLIISIRLISGKNVAEIEGLFYSWQKQRPSDLSFGIYYF